MRVVITGVAGFIGYNIARELLENNCEVVGLDNFFSGMKSNVVNLEKYSGFTFHEIDLCQKFEPESLIPSCDVVIHLAADVSVRRSVENPNKSISQNLFSSVNVANASQIWGAKRFLFASSCAVYGSQSDACEESQTILRPATTYGVTKLSGEHLIQILTGPNCECTSMRFFNVYGPHQALDSDYGAVIPTWINRMLKDEKLVIFGNGEQTRDFVFIKDLCCIINELMNIEIRPCLHRTLNIGSGNSISLNTLANRISEIGKHKLNKDIEIEYLDSRHGDVNNSACDNSELSLCIKDFKFTDLLVGLSETVEYFKDQKQ